ncbi:MAG TPA: hypothetical protein PKZ15_04970 [Paludibacteraceae bacterium]|nr:hypothetical protein [Paludibacteraceae bacterium]
MKKIFLLFMMFGALSFGFTACSDDEDEDQTENNNQEDDCKEKTTFSSGYLGQMNVLYQGQNNVSDSVNVIANYNAININMKQVKFVPQMPSVDLTFSNVSYKKIGEIISFSSDSIVPLYEGEPLPKYAGKNLKGTINGDSISFSVTLGSYPVTYKGTVNDGSDYLGQLGVLVNGQNSETDNVNVAAYYSSISLDMMQVKFVPQMPVRIDITLPNIPSTANGKSISFAADSVVPTMAGKPVEKYTGKNLKGVVSGDSISFSLDFGDYPTSYKGVIVK